jgi:hypothetical protein
MGEWERRSLWFSRLVLGGAALLMTRVGIANIADPVETAARTSMTLGSPDAITVMRVEGGIFVGMAAVLAFCLTSERRVLAGLGFFATIIIAITAVRLLGLVLDGPGPFTLMVLKPEVVLVLLSLVGVALERRRARVAPRPDPAKPPARASRQPA